jgi:hypothetical protein
MLVGFDIVIERVKKYGMPSLFGLIGWEKT